MQPLLCLSNRTEIPPPDPEQGCDMLSGAAVKHQRIRQPPTRTSYPIAERAQQQSSGLASNLMMRILLSEHMAEKKGTTVNAGERSTKRKIFGLIVIGLIVFALVGFTAFILKYFASNPNAFNPTPQYDLNIPLRFNYYYDNGTPDYAGTPNFAITIWLTGKTPVEDTILAGQPFTISARADQSNNSSPLKDTRLIVIFFQDSLTSPASNDTDLLPSTGVTTLCQGGECNCTSTQTCAIPLPPTSTSQFFWSKVNGTFYFPISGSFSPVIRFFTLGPNNQTSFLATATGPNIGDITLNVEPASFAQEVYIGNASLVLTIAVFIFGVIESIIIVLLRSVVKSLATVS